MFSVRKDLNLYTKCNLIGVLNLKNRWPKMETFQNTMFFCRKSEEYIRYFGFERLKIFRLFWDLLRIDAFTFLSRFINNVWFDNSPSFPPLRTLRYYRSLCCRGFGVRWMASGTKTTYKVLSELENFHEKYSSLL